MRELTHTWDAADPREREALASEVIGHARDLAANPVWQLLTAALQQSVSDLTANLLHSADRDEWNRGAISALNHALTAPDRLIRAASSELTKHRGT